MKAPGLDWMVLERLWKGDTKMTSGFRILALPTYWPTPSLDPGFDGATFFGPLTGREAVNTVAPLPVGQGGLR